MMGSETTYEGNYRIENGEQNIEDDEDIIRPVAVQMDENDDEEQESSMANLRIVRSCASSKL
jgi:hypothetical protein